jgi:formate-dependent nitrite reductase cytochrome c552 subunit
MMLVVWLAAGCNPSFQPDSLQAPAGEPRFGVTIHTPEKLTSIESVDPAGGAKNLRIACVTCHSLRETRPLPGRTSELDEFHVGIVFTHGELTCASCHAEGQPPRLRLADGRALDLRDALQLCAQCHGPQWRDYQHGAHGGMRGYWDAARGARERNHCVDCHDPHNPKFVGGRPVLPPRDRFLPVPAPEGPH